MTIVWSIIAFLVAIAILVTVHEAGHYLVARWCNVRVRRFSVGFGRPLLSWRGRGPDRIEYCLSAIPLGGYVQMLDEREGEVDPAERHRAFNNRPLGQRTAIVAAGPAANFLFAVVAYWLVAVLGMVEMRPIVDEPITDSPAEMAGFERGEEIVAIDSRDTPTWQRVAMGLMNAGFNREDVPVTVRDEAGNELERSLNLRAEPRLKDTTDILGTIGLRAYTPDLPATIGRLAEGGAAAQADLREGDRIRAIDGEAVGSWLELVERVEPRANEPVTLTYEREGQVREVTLTLGAQERGEAEVGMLGVGPAIPEGYQERMEREVRHGPVAGVAYGVERTWDTTVVTVKMLVRMVMGEASLKNIGGPVTIGQFAGDTASMGVVPFLTFLAVISISLGIINLLPIPILDGGHLLYFLTEAIRGKPVSERTQLIGQQVGIVILLGLMALAFYNDFERLLGG
ncbi:RIP metalloprotease RseP [Halorhodospira sp. 9621]|uniref:RIP metalloprotease RseP n=1 Tax=Halorhodospira TaxID=85108 RepID=UPI001913AC32|nr:MULTISPECIES: RIP metalloprotease RseP [Halorhodospira]MBK5943778.1 RIP metalloprotease RseP [Halorhodospira halophila]MCG5532201.1 RIP metalloprotease RseP [Halorhodospira sp. 9621]